VTVSVQRLTIFAVLSVFEMDARELLVEKILPEHPLAELIGDEAARTAIERFSKIYPSESANDRHLIEYTDLGDSIRALLGSKSLLPKDLGASLTSLAGQLEQLPAVRNRVMHMRPLQFEDLPLVSDLTRSLVQKSPASWPRTAELCREIGRGGEAVAAYAAIFSAEDRSDVLHNLPTPDFEDTGFMGRREQVAELTKALRGPYPVITVLGIGGVGKTALTLNAAYDIMSGTTCPFDAIIWTTAKTNTLTQSDITEIKGSISTSLGIAAGALDMFGESVSSDPFSQVLDMLSKFKILLIVDNLETVLDEKIRNFVRDIPSGSKVLFTSRVGLGAYDFTVPVGSLTAKESEAYFRRVASVWRQNALLTAGGEAVKSYCTRLQHNPLGIKWFVQAVAAGAPPQRLLAEPKAFLKFCLENVADKLSANARDILDVLVVTSRQQSPASIHYISDIDPSIIQDGLRELLTSNLILISTGKFGEEDRYQISPLALTYLSRYHRLSESRQSHIRSRQTSLLRAQQAAEIAQDNTFYYDPSRIYIRRDFASTDAVSASFLRRALYFIKENIFDGAFLEIEKAKQLTPTYFEVLRVEAFAATQSGNIIRAQAAYEEAIALKPDYPPLRVLYAGFLLRFSDDPSAACDQLLEAKLLDSSEISIRVELARAYLHMHEHTKAVGELTDIDVSQARNARLSRIYYDIFVQTFVRIADSAYARRDAEAVRDQICGLAEYAKSIPPHAIDHRIDRNIRIILNTANRMALVEGKSPIGLDIQNAIGSLYEKLNAARTDLSEGYSGIGFVSGLPNNQPYGFLDAENGERLFFHRNFFGRTTDFDRLRIGDRLVFSIGQNAQGRCAVDLELISGGLGLEADAFPPPPLPSGQDT